MNCFKFLVCSLFLISANAQAGIPTVTFNPPLTVGSVEHFTISDSGSDVTSNFTIQSIAPDAISGYTPAHSATAIRSNQQGSFSITFISNVDSSTFTINANYTANPAYVQLLGGAGQSTTTGSALAQPIKVQVSDASGNSISGATVNWSITGSGGTFSPSTTDSSGIASTTLTMGSTPGTFSITATAGSVSSTDLIQATANPTSNQLSNLIIAVQPSSSAQQNIIFPIQPSLSLTNGSGAIYNIGTQVNVSPFSNSACTDPAGGILGGTTTITSSGGTATFTNLTYSLNAGLFLKFSAGSLNVCSSQISVAQPSTAATKLALNFTPTSAFSGTAFNLLVNVTDNSGNIIASASNAIGLAAFTDSGCSTPATGNFANSTAINAYSGQALFNSLTYNNVETIYIKATASGLSPICSTGIQIKTNPASVSTTLAFVSGPTNEFAGQLFGVQPFVIVQNSLGTIVQNGASAPITIAAYSNSGCTTPASGTMTGSALLHSVYGVGAYTNLSYSASGTIYLGVSAPGLTSACSAAITMNPTPASQAAKLKFTNIPSTTAILNTFLASQPTVEVDDSSGAAVTGVQGYIAMNWYSDSACSTLASGASELDARITNGVAAFNYLGMTTLGTYYLGASFNNLATLCSSAVSITLSCSGTQHYDSGSQTCQDNVASCTIANGTGTKTWDGSAYSLCTETSCNTNFDPIANGCYASCSTSQHHDSSNGQACANNIIDCTSQTPNAISSTATWNGSAYGTCTVQSCQTNYYISSNSCMLQTYNTLAVSVIGNGNVIGTPNTGTGSINCPQLSSCSSSFFSNSTVSLVETPNYGNSFNGWANDCLSSGTSSTCSLSLNAARNATATFTSNFNQTKGFNAAVTGFIKQASGKYVVSGYFTSYQGVTANYIARLNANGTLDTTFNSGGSGFDNAAGTLVQDSSGNIYVGGAFTTYNGIAYNANRFAKLDSNGNLLVAKTGNVNGSTGNGFSGQVTVLKIDSSGNIWAGGSFSNYYGGNVSAGSVNHIAKLTPDGTLTKIYTGDSFASPTGNGFNSTVQSIVFDSSNNAWIGGGFITYYGTNFGGGAYVANNANAIAKLNSLGVLQTIKIGDVAGALTNGFGSGNNVYSMAFDSLNNLWVGGSFTTYYGGGSGTSNNANNIAKILSSGSLGVINSSDIATATGNGTLQQIFSLGVDISNNVYAVTFTTPQNFAYVGNALTPIGGPVRISSSGVASASFGAGNTTSGWNAVWPQSDGSIFIGGTRGGIQKLTSSGAIDPSFNQGFGFNAIVNAAAIQTSGKIIVVGNFNYFNGYPTPYIARLNTDGTLDTTFNSGGSGFNSSVSSLTIDPSGNIWAGGAFTNYNGVSNNANHIAKLTSNGALAIIRTGDIPATNGNGFNGSNLYSLVVDPTGSYIWAGGNFTTYYGGGATGAAQNSNYVAKIKLSDGSLTLINSSDTSSATGNGLISGSSVYAIKFDAGGGVYIGGFFSNSYIGGVQKYVNNILKLNATNGAFQTITSGDTYVSGSGNGFSASVYTLNIDSSGNVWAGGAFGSYYGGSTTNFPSHLAKLSSTGVFISLPVTFDNYVSAIDFDSSGHVWLAGSFTAINGVSYSANYIAKLDAGGNPLYVNVNDTNGYNGNNGFSSSTSTARGHIVFDSSGRLILFGSFLSYKTTLANYIFRMNPDGTESN
jgi:uncharacterized delta-60 repeat protein